jgi:hypothetical protein
MFSFLAQRTELIQSGSYNFISKLRLGFMSDGTAHSRSSDKVAHAPITDMTYMKEI